VILPEMQIEAAQIQANRSEATHDSGSHWIAAAAERAVANAEAIESKPEEIEIASKQAAQSDIERTKHRRESPESANRCVGFGFEHADGRRFSACPEPSVRAQVPSRHSRGLSRMQRARSC
jgi:hypothetical protein